MCEHGSEIPEMEERISIWLVDVSIMQVKSRYQCVVTIQCRCNFNIGTNLGLDVTVLKLRIFIKPPYVALAIAVIKYNSERPYA